MDEGGPKCFTLLSIIILWPLGSSDIVWMWSYSTIAKEAMKCVGPLSYLGKKIRPGNGLDHNKFPSI